DDRCRLPYGRRARRAQQVPRYQGQRSLGWRIPFLLGLLCGPASSRMPHRLWDTRGHEPPGPALFGSQDNGWLDARPWTSQEPRGQSQRWHTLRRPVQAGGVLVKAASNVGALCGHARPGVDLIVAYSKEQQDPVCGEGHHRVERGLRWEVPWGPRKMI